MAKATMTMEGGATVVIEGSQEEVAGLLARFKGREQQSSRATTAPKKLRPTPMGLISELIGEGFFSEPKELGSVKEALRQKGHFYPVTTLSPLMLRLVRRKELRRLKEGKRWTYVG